MEAKDLRIKMVNEILSGIKVHLKSTVNLQIFEII